MNTDSCLLGVLSVPKKTPQNILDIGTGTGLLAMMLAQRFPSAQIEALELQENIYLQALSNIQNSIYSNRIAIKHIDFFNYVPESNFDLIVCNPPFFPEHKTSNSDEKYFAMHNHTLSLAPLFSQVVKILSMDGIFGIILPWEQEEYIVKLAAEKGLFIQTVTRIYSSPGKASRVMIEFSHHQFEASFNELILKENGQNTEEFTRLMQDFYLENTEVYRRDRKTQN